MNLVKVLFKAAQTVSIKVQDLLIESMTKAVKDVIESEIAGYRSKFKDEFKTKLQDSLKAGFDGMELSDYTSFIMDAVKSKHSEILKDVDISGIESTINGVIAPLESEYKLSKLVDMFKNSFSEIKTEDYEECFFECEYNHDRDWYTIKMALSEDRLKSDGYIEFMLHRDSKNVEEWSVFILKTITDYNKYEENQPATVSHFSDFQMLMLKIKSSRKTKVIIDEDYVDTHYSNEYED